MKCMEFVMMVVLSAPLLSMVWMTIRRVHKGPNFKFQYHLSDMLVASIFLPLAIMLFGLVFKNAHENFFVVYFTVAACFGALVGKFWHLTTIDNTWRNGPTYILVGSALWTIASIGPLISMVIVLVMLNGLPNC